MTSSASQTTREFPASESVMSYLHRLLKGRYWLAGILAVSFGLLGGYLGEKLPKPVYRSQGLLQIRPALPKVLFASEQSDLIPMYEAFMESQAALLRSARLMAEATEMPAWQRLKINLPPSRLRQLNGKLEVNFVRKSELLEIGLEDPDPLVAQGMVSGLIQAYLRQATRGDQEIKRLNILEDRQKELARRQEELRLEIAAITDEYGTASLEALYQAKAQELQKIQEQYHGSQLALAIRLPEVPASQPGEMPAIASLDPDLRDAFKQRDEQEKILYGMREHLTPNHPARRAAEAEMQRLDEKIRDYQRREPRGVATMVPERVASDRPTLELQVRQLQALRQRTQEELVALGRKNLVLQDLQNQWRQISGRVDETIKRLEQLRVEGNITGRIQVINPGDLPLAPSTDRRPQLRVLGALGAALAGVAMVACMGLLNPRLRDLDDARLELSSQVRLLGILPWVPQNLADDQQADMAAHCVHHIRTMLQLQCPAHGSSLIAVTSPTSGDGKTSLTIALGLSFARSSARTLLIDGDLVGGGLSARCGQLVTGSEHQGAWGLEAYLGGAPMGRCLESTRIANLTLLRLGNLGADRISRLSPRMMQRLLQEARREFDTVLIDTGPILGSLEAASLTPKVDGVILTLSRGASAALARRAVEQLVSLEAPMAGVVFNRARSADLLASVCSSMPSVARKNRPRESRRELVGLGPLGPLADSIGSEET